jgi:predicted permease
MTLLTGNEWDSTITIAGYEAKPGEDMGPHFNSVSGGFFDTLGIKVIGGRTFTERDERNAPQVAIVNQSFARRYFGDRSPLGRRFGVGGDPGTPTNIEIVGVVADHRYESLRDEIPREVYLCELQRDAFGKSIYIRTTARPENAFPALRAAVRELDANLPLVNMKTMDRQLDESLVTERLVATLSAVFGALATLLAVIGLYGVMSFMVARRAREIGIRMAIGAAAADVVWLVMREVLVLALAGVAIGLPAAVALARLVRSQLYGVEPADPISIGLATLLLFSVAAAAGYMPARRAAAYDPVRVLRGD